MCVLASCRARMALPNSYALTHSYYAFTALSQGLAYSCTVPGNAEALPGEGRLDFERLSEFEPAGRRGPDLGGTRCAAAAASTRTWRSARAPTPHAAHAGPRESRRADSRSAWKRPERLKALLFVQQLVGRFLDV